MGFNRPRFANPGCRPCARTVRQGPIPLAAHLEIESRARAPAACAPTLDNVRCPFAWRWSAVLASKFLPPVVRTLRVRYSICVELVPHATLCRISIKKAQCCGIFSQCEYRHPPKLCPEGQVLAASLRPQNRLPCVQNGRRDPIDRHGYRATALPGRDT